MVVIMRHFIYVLLAYSLLNNIVLSTGFGFSVMMRNVRNRHNILPFSILLCLFSVLTVSLCYPIDYLVGRDISTRWLRPLVIIAITAVLYFAVRFALEKLLPRISERTSRLLPSAAFNNLVIGVSVIIFMRDSTTFFEAVARSLGSSIGFLVLSWVTAEGMERLDNPDIPKAFRGLPSIFIYLGLLALASMGWKA